MKPHLSVYKMLRNFPQYSDNVKFFLKKNFLTPI